MPFNFGTPTPAPTPTPQPTGSFNFLAGAPASAGSFNFATGTPTHPKKTNGAASFLEKVSDVLDVPLAYAEAGGADVLGGGHHLEQVTKDLESGGAHNVAQNDIYFRQGSLQRVLADPNASAEQKATAQWFMKHPWVAGAADFATEFANPSNLVLGPIGGAVGKVLRPVARLATKIPYIGEGLDAAVDYGKSLVNKYHPLAKLSKNAAQGGRLADAGARMATKQNEALQREVYGVPGMLNGTTAEERFEIWRRAHGEQPMDPTQLAQVYPHTPGFTGTPGTLTDQQLWERAQLERAAYEHGDQELLQRGWAEPEDLMSGYFKIRPKTFYDEDAFDRAAAQFPTFRRGIGPASLRYAGPNLKEKVFRSPDEILKANERLGGSLLAKGADPANEFLAHLNQLSGNVALDEFIRQLTQEAPEAARELDASALGFHVPGGTVTKNSFTRNVSSGEATLAKGLQIAQRNARSVAARKAINEVAQRFGMSEGDVSRIAKRLFPQEARVSARLEELARASKAVRKVGDRATTTANDVLSQQRAQIVNRANELFGRLINDGVPSDKSIDDIARDLAPQGVTRKQVADALRTPPPDATTHARVEELMRGANALGHAQGRIVKTTSDIANRLQAKMLERAQNLAAKLTDPERAIGEDYRKLRDNILMSEAPKARDRMLAKLNPSGYNLVKNVPGLSGLKRLQYTSLAPELVEYLTDFGAPAKDAKGLGAFLDRFNSLYRIGIVTNPIVHPFYNLMWAYLGQGGNPIRLAKVFRGEETALDREAEQYGAHAYFNGSSALGGNNAQMLLGKFSQAPGISGKIDWTLSRLSDANRALVFDRLERNMATELWDDLAKKSMARGIEPEQAKRLAGEAVRKAFGDYDNITTAERNITKAFYFYPWTKTVIPFWIKAGMQRPQLVTGPMRAIQTHNALAGDQNVGSEKPYTVYLGTDKNGQPIYKSVPLPQRWLEDVGETITPRVGGQVDMGAGIPAHLQSLSNVALNHMTPGVGIGTHIGVQLANSEPQEPGVTPASGVVFNRAAPLATQVQQIASYIVQQGVPFGGNIANLASAAQETLRGNPQALPQALVGGYVYSEHSPQENFMLNRYMNAFIRQYYHYAHVFRDNPQRRDTMQAQAYRVFRMKADRLLKRQQ